MERKEVYDIIERHYKINQEALVKKLTGVSGSRENAEDIVQEAYTRALKYQSSLNAVKGADFNKWFSKILRNAMNKHFSDEKQRGMVRTQVMIDSQVNLDLDYHRKFLEEIGQMIEKKAENQAYILNLFFFHQYKPSDIAELVPESNEAIRQIIYRFRKELKEMYRAKKEQE